MKTYYLVKTIIRDTLSIIRYEGTIECEEKPINKFTSNAKEGVYEDWFDSEKEALDFVRECKQCI